MREESSRTHDVFLSYSSKDKTWADAACAVLERHGVRCWIAPRDITPGDEWGAAIIKGLNGSRIMVLIFSGHANASRHVRREVERAISQGMTVLPVRIEDVRPEGSMEFALGNTHWLDAFTPPMERQLELLARSVQTLLANDPESLAAPAPAKSAAVAPAKSPEPRPRRVGLFGLAARTAVLSILLLGILVYVTTNKGRIRIEVNDAQGAADKDPVRPDPRAGDTGTRESQSNRPIQALIITGDNNRVHKWEETSQALEEMLEKGDRIKVDITKTPARDLAPENLAHYDVLILNYRDTPDGSPETQWSDANKEAFLKAVYDGKGLVAYHHASAAFIKPNWDEFEKAVAGGWRSQAFHGPSHAFTVKKADAKHPISEGLPTQFEHVIDELYSNSMIVPGSTVLATAYSDPAKPKGTGKDEPVIWVNHYGKGRVYENVLGHDTKAMADPNFQEWMRRGVIWAATGKSE